MTAAACRNCGSLLNRVFVDLGMSPLANSFVSAADADKPEPFYPLKAFVCDRCLLVQLKAYETSERIFSEYLYFSSFASSWVEHARAYVEQAKQRFRLGPESQVVEVASNDGYLLQFFVRAGIPVLGIEPAANIAAAANERGVPTRAEFFGAQTASTLRSEGLSADLIVNNNVLAHVPDLHDFVAGWELLLKRDGVVTVEFPHVLELIRFNQFDTIYHEHFSYLSLRVVQELVHEHGLRVFDVERLPTHGGSLRVFVCRTGSQRPQCPGVNEVLAEERSAGLHGVAGYEGFERGVVEAKCELLDFLIRCRRRGERVAGYGAPAKGNTLLNYAGVGPELMPYTVDRSPHKQGRMLPGVRIPICAPSRILEERPSYVLILPWNLRDEITREFAAVQDWGGRFVVAIPRLQLL